MFKNSVRWSWKSWQNSKYSLVTREYLEYLEFEYFGCINGNYGLVNIFTTIHRREIKAVFKNLSDEEERNCSTIGYNVFPSIHTTALFLWVDYTRMANGWKYQPVQRSAQPNTQIMQSPPPSLKVSSTIWSEDDILNVK